MQQVVNFCIFWMLLFIEYVLFVFVSELSFSLILIRRVADFTLWIYDEDIYMQMSGVVGWCAIISCLRYVILVYGRRKFVQTVSTSLRAETMVDGLPRAFRFGTRWSNLRFSSKPMKIFEIMKLRNCVQKINSRNVSDVKIHRVPMLCAIFKFSVSLGGLANMGRQASRLNITRSARNIILIIFFQCKYIIKDINVMEIVFFVLACNNKLCSSMLANLTWN